MKRTVFHDYASTYMIASDDRANGTEIEVDEATLARWREAEERYLEMQTAIGEALLKAGIRY